MTSGGGWFDGSTWWIRTFAAGSRAIEYASAHESHHRQLHSSTSFGGLARILDELTLDRAGPVARDLKKACSRTHEAFACWTPAHALGWSRAELVSIYDGYGTPFDEMQALVEGTGHPYLALHAAHAVARACMQPPVVDIVRAVGLDRVALADFRASLRPDRRFQAVLRRGIAWDGPIGRLSARLAGDDAWEEVLGTPKLTATALRPELASLWEVINREMFEAVADQLRHWGFPTLELDGHLEELAELSLRANELGARYDMTAPRELTARAVLRNIEAEGFTSGEPLDAIWRPAGPLTGMVAGIDDPHVFLTLRPLQSLTPNYRCTGPDPCPTSAAVLRRSVMTDDGRLLVELMDVTDTFPVDPANAPAPVMACVAMSALTSPLAHRFRRYLDARTSSVLVDLPLGVHLDIWLDRPGATFRYVIMRTEAQERVVPMLIAVVDGGDAQSHLLLRPLSHAAVGIHRAAFAELDPSETAIVWDPGVLDLHPELLGLSLSHIVGEEVVFPPLG